MRMGIKSLSWAASDPAGSFWLGFGLYSVSTVEEDV